MVDDSGSLKAAFGRVEDGESDDTLEVSHRQLFPLTTGLIKVKGLFRDGVAAGVGEEDKNGKPEVDAVDRIPVVEECGDGINEPYFVNRINQSPKGIKWSAIPLPCFSLLA